LRWRCGGERLGRFACSRAFADGCSAALDSFSACACTARTVAVAAAALACTAPVRPAFSPSATNRNRELAPCSKRVLPHASHRGLSSFSFPVSNVHSSSWRESAIPRSSPRTSAMSTTCRPRLSPPHWSSPSHSAAVGQPRALRESEKASPPRLASPCCTCTRADSVGTGQGGCGLYAQILRSHGVWIRKQEWADQ